MSSLDIFSPKVNSGALNNRPSCNPAVDIISMEEDLYEGGDVTLPVRYDGIVLCINYFCIFNTNCVLMTCFKFCRVLRRNTGRIVVFQDC